MELENVRALSDDELIAMYKRYLRLGVGDEYHLVVWLEKEIKERMNRRALPIERCPICNGLLAGGDVEDGKPLFAHGGDGPRNKEEVM